MFLASLCFAVPANTLIQNQATATYSYNGSSKEIVSNLSTFRVLEIINHNVITNHPSGLLSLSPDTQKSLSFTLTNTGNGRDSYSLFAKQILGDEYDPTNVRIFLEPAILYIPGVNDPVLEAGDSKKIYIISDIPAGLNSGDQGQLNLEAISNTGTGASGTVLPGAGDGGVDAVIGPSTGAVQDLSFYYINQATVNIAKSQSIQDPLGSNAPIKGAIITYTLDVNLQGSGFIKNAILNDPIPTNTTYIPGSLELDGSALTDSADADVGNFDGTHVRFNLGNQIAPKTIQAKFKVEVN